MSRSIRIWTMYHSIITKTNGMLDRGNGRANQKEEKVLFLSERNEKSNIRIRSAKNEQVHKNLCPNNVWIRSQ